MPRHGKKGGPHKSLRAYVVVTTIAGLVITGLALLSTGDGPDGGSSDRFYTDVHGFADIHGLAIHPENADEIYVATHQGLIRGLDGRWSRVGDMQDDLMGFTMHPTDGSTFWTSGHPRGGGNMGVRKSTDGGFTWRQAWEEKVDFHAMTVSPANPNHLWGHVPGGLYRSTNGGDAWVLVNPNAPQPRMLVGDPSDAATLYATTAAGVSKSIDGGASWAVLHAVPALGLAITPTAPAVMYAGGQDALWKSTDAGGTWMPLTVPAAGHYGYLAVSLRDPNVVYAATYQTGVYKSTDAGAKWAQLKAPRT